MEVGVQKIVAWEHLCPRWLISFLMYPHQLTATEEADLRTKLVVFLKEKSAQELSPNSFRLKLLDQEHMDLMSESPSEIFRLLENKEIMILLDRLEFLYGEPKALLLDANCSYRTKISLFTFDPISQFDGPPEYSILSLNDFKTIMESIFQCSNDEKITINNNDLNDLRVRMFRMVFWYVRIMKR